jgi:hypothetical protein
MMVQQQQNHQAMLLKSNHRKEGRHFHLLDWLAEMDALEYWLLFDKLGFSY